MYRKMKGGIMKTITVVACATLALCVTSQAQVPAGYKVVVIPTNATLGSLVTPQITASSIAAAGGQLAETVVTGAVCTVTSGNRYFFTTATNVVLSASLTGGQVVNYAALRNTATNSITATAESAGWKWTGGSMTNTIPANTMMTFGWSCNPFTGATNFYATAASSN
jgi:hypothetical protein